MLLGLGLFIAAPASAKYGIDFLGGARVKVRTEATHSVDEIRTLVARIPGEIGTTAEVTALPISQEGDGYREFAITFKTPPGDESDTADHFAREIRTALAEIIQRGPIEVSLGEGPEARAHARAVLRDPPLHGGRRAGPGGAAPGRAQRPAPRGAGERLRDRRRAAGLRRGAPGGSGAVGPGRRSATSRDASTSWPSRCPRPA